MIRAAPPVQNKTNFLAALPKSRRQNISLINVKHRKGNIEFFFCVREKRNGKENKSALNANKLSFRTFLYHFNLITNGTNVTKPAYFSDPQRN